MIKKRKGRRDQYRSMNDNKYCNFKEVFNLQQ